MKKLLFLIPLLLLMPIMYSGCGREPQASNNLEQIYREEGVPVKTTKVQPELFETWLSYNAELSGIEESSAHSMVSDEVESIYVKVGDFVQKNQVVLGFPRGNPSARYHQVNVAYENARKNYERIRNLFDSGSISRQELDNAKAAYDVAAADWDSVRQTVEVRAPIEGYVIKINVQESDNVNMGDELFTIAQTDRLKARVWATDKEILYIRKGQKASAVWNGITLTGRVVQVDMALNNDKKAFGVVVEFDNPGSRMRIGVIVDVRINTYRNPRAFVVERKDLIKVGDEYFVYLAKDREAEKRKVVLGRQQGLDVEVADGLVAGEELIVEGQMLLDEGSRVKIVQ
jgi:membrane fusion protein (multidrug efflux system)